MEWLVAAALLARAGRGGRVGVHLAHGVTTVAAAAAVFALQLWAWWAVYGSVYSSGYFYSGHEGFDWWHPQIVGLLFSPFHGLFTWHPIYLAGALGLWLVARNDRAYAALLGLGAAVQVYVVGAWYTWWQGDSFGGRMLISSAPIFAIGLAPVVARLRRVGWWLVAAPAAVLLLWNLAALVQYRFGFIPMGEPITWRQLLWDKLTLPFDLWQRFVHGVRR
jgi:hypothetical protein